MSRYAYEVLLGDVIEILSHVPDSSFDACFCDPPYLLEFMNKQFDRQHKHMSGSYSNDGQRMQAWHQQWTREVFRVLKPGGSILAFGGTRTCHRLASALEDVGLEIRDTIEWIYGQGFPKSYDISKGVDKTLGYERERAAPRSIISHQRQLGNLRPYMNDPNHTTVSDVPASEESARWSGYGTAIKPSHEPLILAMKPCEGTYAQNALTYNVAGLNIDGCRIGSETVGWSGKAAGRKNDGEWKEQSGLSKDGDARPVSGRWPSNLILSHHPDCIEIGVDGVKVTVTDILTRMALETIIAWDCHPLCPVRLLGQQSGITQSRATDYNFELSGNENPSQIIKNIKSGVHFSDRGGASRFFYTAKVSTRERQLGLEHSHSGNNHPTLKPISLCTYLATLLLPPSRPDPSYIRRLLVPFSGTGSEISGAIRAGWDYVLGIEMDPEYVTISQSRIPALISVEK